MKFFFEHRYDVDADTLLACRMDPAWVEAAARLQSSGEAKVSFDEAGGKKRFTVEIIEENRVPVRIPGMKRGPRRNIKKEVVDPVRRTIHWSIEYPDVTTRASIGGVSRIVPDGRASKLVVDCEMKIDLPLVGRVLERFFKGKIMESMGRTAQFTEGWAKENMG